MTLTPLLEASPLIQLHAVCAMTAFVLGIVQFGLPKGTTWHRALGWTWVALLATVALSSFGIRVLRPGAFSVIHVISAFTLITLPIAVLHARRGRVRRHAIAMVSLFLGALLIAGGFTLLPNRIMGRVVFGPPSSAAP